MPLLSVTDLLADPNFADPSGSLSVLRSTETVDQNGRASLNAMQFPIEGVVQPADGTVLRLLPDLAHIESAIEVYTQFRLVCQTFNAAADILVWCGRQYTVRLVEDYSSYGAGYVMAICELKQLFE